ncbi:MAG: Hpt domain-containing protein [Nitrospira sp.]|nr:Hpt domain-containing protein [Nitrospira sp.]MCP9443567.1 Hpt domain-containing protein [Nitrospira sp.]
MSHDQAFDLQEALSRVDDDRETFQLMVEAFLEQGPQDLAAIEVALEKRDAGAVAKSAHRLKGSVLQFCAEDAVRAAKAVEAAGKDGNLPEAERIFPALKTELERLLGALRAAAEKDLAV